MVMSSVRRTQFQHPSLHHLTTGLRVFFRYSPGNELNQREVLETRGTLALESPCLHVLETIIYSPPR